MNDRIKNIKAKEILDSRGNPTIEAELYTEKGIFKASVPSGASVGRYEAVELRDGDKERYNGKGVLKAVKNITQIISPKIKGEDPKNQKKIDNLMIELDKTDDKSKLGANAILAVSLAVSRAGAGSKEINLWQHLKELIGNQKDVFMPLPCFNIINGGAHSNNELDIQEFMVIPQYNSFSENLKTGIDAYNKLKLILKKELKEEYLKIGDEGGFSPMISETYKALDFLTKAVSGYKDIKIGLDCAASQFFKDNKYFIDNKEFEAEDVLSFYNNLIKSYPLIYLEDPFDERDEKMWRIIKNQFINVIIIGDDLTATNKRIISDKKDFISGVIIKPNQRGTITETLEAVRVAKDNGIKIIVSHRSGETEDDFISDLAVGIGADFIKSGAPYPKERMAKYNRLLKIEKTI
ncbi:MAG: phosphopyruvate hydratase [Candidatus Pacebacteria bacterium]|nr:phosphopyruvate hydratase [Candidatus Paceibacterota bacterium]